jgi:hypothetical protein
MWCFILQSFLSNYIASIIRWQVNDDEQTRTNIHALSEIRTHGLKVQDIKAYAYIARPLELAVRDMNQGPPK